MVLHAPDACAPRRAPSSYSPRYDGQRFIRKAGYERCIASFIPIMIEPQVRGRMCFFVVSSRCVQSAFM